jgi:hypothetical protein
MSSENGFGFGLILSLSLGSQSHHKHGTARHGTGPIACMARAYLNNSISASISASFRVRCGVWGWFGSVQFCSSSSSFRMMA